jgi:hypothetical protein
MLHKRRATRQPQVTRLSELLCANQWHSSIGFDTVVSSHQRHKTALDNSPANRRLFIAAGMPGNQRHAALAGSGKAGELLIHRASRALWRVSDDGKRIEPAFEDDIITIDTANE